MVSKSDFEVGEIEILNGLEKERGGKYIVE